MIKTSGYTNEIAEGFLFCLLSSKRPFHEILRPSLLDHKATIDSQFLGMTDEEFTYKMYETTRIQIIHTVLNRMSSESRNLIMSFSSGNPDWSIIDYSKFPGIQWKLQNIRKLREENQSKLKFQLNELEKIFNNEYEYGY